MHLPADAQRSFASKENYKALTLAVIQIDVDELDQEIILLMNLPNIGDFIEGSRFLAKVILYGPEKPNLGWIDD